MIRSQFLLNWKNFSLRFATLQAWSAIKKCLHYKQPLSILASLVENSGLCPQMGAYFSSWKQAGVNHIYDLFSKGQFMTFDKIMSHFHITQKDFYKYLQIRRYVSIRNGGLSIGNYDHFLEKCFLCSSDTQKNVSKFYSMLVERWQNKFTDLQKSWSKKVGMISMLLHGKHY